MTIDQAAVCAGVLMLSTQLVNVVPPLSRYHAFAAAITNVDILSRAVCLLERRQGRSQPDLARDAYRAGRVGPTRPV